MQKGLTADHFFETDASAARRVRQAAKADNQNGDPITLKSKPLGVILDPTSPNSLLVAESTGSVRRVNLETGETKQVYRGPSAPVTCVAVGGSGNQTIFAGSWDKDIWTWDVTSKVPGRKLSGHSDFVKAVVTAKIGGKDVLFSGGADKKIIVWDTATGSRLHVLQDQVTSMMAVQDLAVDPVESSADEVILVSASSDPNIRRWRVRLDSYEQITEGSHDETGEVVHTILQHETTVYKLLFDQTDDEVGLWTASGDGTAKSLARGKGFAVDDVITHGDHVRAVAVTDQWIITAGRDEDIKVWDRASGKQYGILEGHYDEVIALIVTSGPAGTGDRLISASLDGTIRTWSLQKNDLDKFIQEQLEKAKGAEKEASGGQEANDLTTADEDAELAALMEEDDD